MILYNSNPGNSAAQAVKIFDDFSMVSPISANYRFFHLSPDVPAIDLYLNNSISQTQRAAADNVINPGLNAFQPIAPTIYLLQVKLSGTDSVLASLPGVQLLAGGVYTIFLNGTYTSVNNLSINVLQATY